MALEYFLASLPALSFGAEPPMDLGSLFASAEGKVPAAAIACARSLAEGGPGDGGTFASAWRNSETQLRNAVALARAARLGQDAADARKWLRPHADWSVETETGVTAAFAQPDPQARHLALQRLRWDRAGTLAGLSPFSVEAFFAYALRLSILIGLAARTDAAAGLAKLDAAASGTRPS